MPSKKRDLVFSRRVRLPWGPDIPCPCGSAKRAADCCRLQNGLFYKPVSSLLPSGPATHFANERCYLKRTHDCSTKISGEHFLSASVLRLVDQQKIKLRGMRRAPEGIIVEVPISTLKSNILCQRHNGALSPLDGSAHRFFSAVQQIFDDLADLKTPSREKKWLLFSGEELELWLVKTAFGLYMSGMLAKGPDRLNEHQTLNPAILSAFQGMLIAPPCGVYVMATEGEHIGQRHSIDVAVISSTDEKQMTGLTLAFMGLTFLIALDPLAGYGAFNTTHTFRPDFIQFRNRKRFHNIVLTWPDFGRRKQKAVLYTKAPNAGANRPAS